MKNTYERNIAGYCFRYFVVIVTALVTVFGITMVSKAIFQRGADVSSAVPVVTEQNVSTILKNGLGHVESNSRYDAIAETSVTAADDSEKLLSDMVTIPSGKLNTMFRIATDVEDYYGNTYSKAYLLHGDGLAGYYNNAVKFRNDDGYCWIRGQIALENTEYNEHGMEYGYMKLILMDIDGNVIDSTQEINDRSSKKADVNFYIGSLDEFMIAVDCTDGRAGGGLMSLIANDFIVAK